MSHNNGCRLPLAIQIVVNFISHFVHEKANEQTNEKKKLLHEKLFRNLVEVNGIDAV